MKLKRTLTAVVAAVMAFTAVATPLGDNLPAVRDSVSITAEALSVGDIDNKMQQLSQKYPNGANWQNYFGGGYYQGTSQCFGFARFIFNQLFGCDVAKSYSAYYKLSSNQNVNCLGTITSCNYTSAYNLLRQAKKGDFIQAQSSYGPHSMIVVGADNNNIYIYDANWDTSPSSDVIRYNAAISYSKFASTFSYGISLYRYNNYPSETWYGNRNVENIGTGFYANIINAYSSKYVAVNGTNVELADPTSEKHAVWYFERRDDGSYKITNCKNNQALDVKGCSAEPEANVQTYESNDTDAQRWFLYRSGDGYLLRPKCADNVLDAHNGGTTAGTNIKTWILNESGAQVYKIWKLNVPSASKVSVKVGTSYTPTVFTWTATSDTTEYTVKIWKGKLWAGDPYNIKWNATGNTYSIQLPEGHYEAYVDSCNTFSVTKSSNNVSFDVVKGECPHSYGAWSVVTYPTCTAQGVEQRTCSRCSKAETRYITALGHSWSGWSTTTYPTCTAQGVEQRTCSRCSKAETRYITALGHNYSSEWTIDKQATCSAEGSKSKHCTRCDAKTEVTVIPKTAHSYKTTVVAPTLTAQGYTLHECTVCHYSYKDSYTSQITLPAVTGVKVKTQGSTSLTLAWDKNASANGYVVEQYKGGKWTQIAKTSRNATVTYTVNGLKADTTYTFRIKGYVVSGTTEYSGEYTRLAAKTRIANVGTFKGSTVSGSAVKLDWSRNDKATGYVIEQYKGGKWTALATTKNNTTLTFTVKGLASATVYSFRIKSFRTVNGKTDYSEYTSLKAATSFGGVNNLTVKSYTASAITLAWNKNASANGYVVEQYKGGKWIQIAKTSSNAVVSYTVSGLAADATYTFRVRAYKTAAGKTIYSEYTRLAAKTRIANVGTFKGSTVSDSAVKLDWSKNDKASGYIIEQYKGGKWTALATTKNNTTLTFTVKGLASATVYSFRIKSFRTVNGKTDYSEYTSLKAATSFGGVNNLTVKSYTASAITLAWNKNASANGYVIEQYKGGKWTQIAKTSSNATVTYTVNGLKADTTYTFRVRAYKTAAGKTIYSEYTRLAAKTRIAKVASFRVTGTTTSAVELSWNKNAKATGYIIETYRGGKWTVLATTKNNTTLTFTVKGLARNTTYSFRIKAFRKTGSTTEFSEYSSLKATTRK